jgi:hypothetical protein
MFNNLTTKTMDKTLISGKDLLFAYCVTDGALDNMGEEQRASVLLTITEIKESMLNVSVYIKERD